MERELVRRIRWSTLLIGFGLYMIYFAPFPLFVLMIEAFIFVGLYEFVQICRAKGYQFHPYLLPFIGLTAPLLQLYHCQELFFLGGLVILFVVRLKMDDTEKSMREVLLGMLGLVWIAWFLSYTVMLKQTPHGSFWVLYAVFVVKIGDAGAYFIGKKFGKTPFFSKLSPKKTWEGAAGGLAVSILTSLAAALIVPLSLPALFLMGAVSGVLGQVGDLIESMIKRALDVKDSGQIPGLGGILDIFDSILISVPLTYFYATQWAVFAAS